MWGCREWTKHYKVIFILQCVLYTRSYAAMIKQITSLNSNSPSDNVKYILLWQARGSFKNIFGEGKEIFLHNDCPVDECYVSSDKNLFKGDLRKFDAILFSGWDQKWYKKGKLPEKRFPHQKYAFVQRESAAKSYVCHKDFDNFFNWTITYRLDSDIVFPHIHIKDTNENIIGPRKNMHWITDMQEVDDSFATDLGSKTKAVAWFYTNCDPPKANREFVENLQHALSSYGLNIDVYGKCGPLHCPMHECDQMLDKDYFFYLALEDSIAEDYVTGNILRALRNNVVPIVYGGAKYNRFLPPQSYLDGTTQTPEALAAIINDLVKNQTMYTRYFRWKSHYSYSLGQATPSMPLEGIAYNGQTICDLCKALHDPKKFKFRSEYKDFRKWWYPDYEEKCGIKKEVQQEKNDFKNVKPKSKQTKKKQKSRKKKKSRKEVEEKEMKQENYQQTNHRDQAMSSLRRGGVLQGMGDEMVVALLSAMLGMGGGSGGGGGGGIVRTAGMVATEIARCRISLGVNNFDIYRRR